MSVCVLPLLLQIIIVKFLVQISKIYIQTIRVDYNKLQKVLLMYK